MLRDIQFQSGHDMLAGTVHMPPGSGSHPALVMLQGSGPTDRDSNGYFPPIRDHFLQTGIAVLSWDKPGIGRSSGHWTRQTFFDRADEALAGLGWLRNQPGIDANRVGIWGHSQGGWVGPLAASQDPSLDFLIVNSGPGIPAQEQDLYGIEHTFRHGERSEGDLNHALQFMKDLHLAAAEGLEFREVVAKILEPAAGTSATAYFGEIDANLWHFFVINAHRPYDPVRTLEAIRCPILAIFGEADTLVPVDLSASVFNAARASDPDRDITVRIFPEANHRILSGDSQDFARSYLETMTNWIWSRIRPGTV